MGIPAANTKKHNRIRAHAAMCSTIPRLLFLIFNMDGCQMSFIGRD